jgi:hypothetical protein
MRIKPRPAPPTGETYTFSQLIIRHLHYDDYNTLLKLPALDEGDTIDYDTAPTICGIVCDNNYGIGWFAKSRDGSRICAPGTPGEVYYFTTEDRSCRSLLAGSLRDADNVCADKYPVCPSWDQWRVPSNICTLPSGFASFQIPPPPPYLRNGGFMNDLQIRDGLSSNGLV